MRGLLLSLFIKVKKKREKQIYNICQELIEITKWSHADSV